MSTPVRQAVCQAIRLPRMLALMLIRTYQYALSPLLGPRCRFVPSCSEYAVEAIAAHGLLRGLFLSARRLSRCHPWHPGGYDPCPAPSAHSREKPL